MTGIQAPDSPIAQAIKTTPDPWYALKVRTGGESRVKNALERKGYQLLLPTYTTSRRYCDRIQAVTSALFPGYLFCSLNVELRLPVLQTVGVEHFVGIKNIPEPLPNNEIHSLQQVASLGIKAEPCPYLKTGDRVVIQHGTLTGVTGILIEMKNHQRLVLSADILQRSISIEVDRGWVHPSRDLSAPRPGYSLVSSVGTK